MILDGMALSDAVVFNEGTATVERGLRGPRGRFLCVDISHRHSPTFDATEKQTIATRVKKPGIVEFLKHAVARL